MKRLGRIFASKSSAQRASQGSNVPESPRSPHSSESHSPRRSLESQPLLAPGGLEPRRNSSAGEVGSSRRRVRLGAGSTQQNRPIFTVVEPTQMAGDGSGRVRHPGHIQFQTSQEEQDLYGVGPVLGHGPMPGLPNRERFPVRSTLHDGSPFNVAGIRADARRAGEDSVLPRETPGLHIYDHGTMTPEQAARYHELEGRHIFGRYETSGVDGTNCVSAYAAAGQHIFGESFPANPQYMHPHTLPQEMGEMTSHFRTDHSSDSEGD